MSEHIGYIRVSSEGQNTARQLDGVKLDKTYVDKQSGATKHREQLQACLAYIRKGDTLHVHALDRLARSLRDLLEILETALAKGVTVTFHAESLTFSPDSNNPHAMLMMQLLGSFAQFERSISKVRQREGITKAKQSGKHLGRPRMADDLYIEAKKLRAEGLGITEICKALNLSKPSVYKLLA